MDTVKKDDAEKVMVQLVTPDFIWQVGQVLTFGAKKYAANNWKQAKGADQQRTYGSIQRHLLAWQRGEKIDPETGLSQLAHAATQLMFLMYYDEHGMGAGAEERPVSLNDIERHETARVSKTQILAEKIGVTESQLNEFFEMSTTPPGVPSDHLFIAPNGHRYNRSQLLREVKTGQAEEEAAQVVALMRVAQRLGVQSISPLQAMLGIKSDSEKYSCKGNEYSKSDVLEMMRMERGLMRTEREGM